ncbi:MAG: outer membrane protein assembly factor BamD [Alphaproteobacteria bacterium]|nr:outer membrane protein assembly factor BamD [Alphaproteobacteria bacterium]
MIRKNSILMAIGAAAIALSATSCASNREREARQYREEPVADLYNFAVDRLEQRRWSEAAAAFEEVERQHPYSSWARRAVLMGAYANYMARKYDKAIEGAQRFAALHPGNESAPYAYYLVAICYFEQILDVGRDQGITQQALAALQEVVRRFPDSDYARDARLKIDMTYDQLAGKEMEVGRFYLRQGQTLAAMNRFRRVVEDEHFQRTTHAPEALHRLVEAYLTVGMTEEAQRAAAVLGHNYPGNAWYERTYALMSDRGVQMVEEPEARRRGWFARTLGRLF